MRRVILTVLVVTLVGSGCITRSGKNLPPIQPQPPTAKAQLEQTVGNFQFTLEGGKMVTSNKAGRQLNDQILSRWQKKGYIAGSQYVKSAAFTGQADYNLTLSGSQYGDSSVIAQVISGLTLMVIPYTVDTRYDIQYVLEKVSTGEQYSAAVEDSFHTTVELLLFLVAPISMRGHNATMDAMADHLYEQLRAKGAFGP